MKPFVCDSTLIESQKAIFQATNKIGNAEKVQHTINLTVYIYV